MSLEEAESLLKLWRLWSGIFSSARGASGGLGILWNLGSHAIEELVCSQSWQVCKVHSFHLNSDFFLINVYGSSKLCRQSIIWEQLSVIMQNLSKELVVLGGDFNATLELVDKKGGKMGISTS